MDPFSEVTNLNVFKLGVSNVIFKFYSSENMGFKF
jgi:hypothetical protein